MNTQILRKVILGGLFILPFVPLLVSGSFFFPFITTKAFVWRPVVEIIFGAWVILALMAKEFRPKRGAVLYALLTFIAVVGVADILGMSPAKSFWSNFERMEGYVLILHLGALFTVMSSVLGEREWRYWWNTSLAASAIMAVYVLFQVLGSLEIHQGATRPDGTIGNAAYLALYMLFHIFIATYYFIRSRGGLRWTYGILIFFQVFSLYMTATRGAILGLIGAAVVVAVLNLFNKESKKAKKWSISVLAVLFGLIAIFFLIRNTSFVQNSPVMSRFANLSMSALKTEGRSFVWPMAIQGIKERPLFGWGQENFNYVFAEHYSAKMFRLEPWFDRAHNVFLDWAIAAGMLGLLAYLSLYLFGLMGIWKSRIDFTEKTILTGLLAAYFFNNIFIFDNLVSYTLFISLLAYIHSRIGVATWQEKRVIDANTALGWAVPVGIFVLLSLYFVNLKPMLSNSYLIVALQNQNTDKEKSMEYFEKAYRGSRLGRPEAVEWISTSAGALLNDPNISNERKNTYFAFAKDAVEASAEELKDDPRVELMAGAFYTSLGFLDDALTHLGRAREIMPQKQQIYYSIGEALFYKKDYQGAIAAFKYAYDLAPENEQAKEIYQSLLKQIPS